ncbi:MAG: TIGR02678 family protein [Desulforudis sp.]|nr:MAG: TIGR02678 family protein [Desulforudis sp.]
MGREREQSKSEFDNAAREAAEHLLEQFWIRRDEEPEKYQSVREREQVLRSYFLDKAGFRLILHRYFAKLEKIPAEPESWMGIQTFHHPRDYAVFCCLLAYLESKAVDEQFLLSDLCEELRAVYPGDDALDWTHYEHRKSLVRVLRTSADLGILKVVDGTIEGFNYAEDNEVLYEVPVVARYFMRSYPKDLFQFATKEEILAADWPEGVDEALKRRHRVYRRLLLSPVMYSRDTVEADFLYLRNYRHRVREDIEKHTGFCFELYRNAALLTLPEQRVRFTLFPDNKAISDIAIQFAAVARERRAEDDIPLQFDGILGLTIPDFQKWVRICKERYGAGWSKQYREAGISQTAKELLAFLVEWKMAERDPETAAVHLRPLLARTTGRYPSDFDPSTVREGEISAKE